jgi:hypothetical protein
VLVYIVVLIQKAKAIKQYEIDRAALIDGAKDSAELKQRQAELDRGVDLHALGEMFLGKISRGIFDACVMLHFVSLLISYALAGSQVQTLDGSAAALTLCAGILDAGRHCGLQAVRGSTVRVHLHDAGRGGRLVPATGHFGVHARQGSAAVRHGDRDGHRRVVVAVGL